MPLFIDSQLSGYTHSVLSLITPAIPFNIAPKEALQVGVKGEDQGGTLNQSVTPNGAGGASATPSPVAGTENVIYFNCPSVEGDLFKKVTQPKQFLDILEI